MKCFDNGVPVIMLDGSIVTERAESARAFSNLLKECKCDKLWRMEWFNLIGTPNGASDICNKLLDEYCRANGYYAGSAKHFGELRPYQKEAALAATETTRRPVIRVFTELFPFMGDPTVKPKQRDKSEIRALVNAKGYSGNLRRFFIEHEDGTVKLDESIYKEKK